MTTSTESRTKNSMLHLVSEAIDAEDTNCSSAENLGALFRAIYLNPEDTYLVKMLAGIGQHLSDDWGYLAETNRAKLDELHRKEL